MEKFIAIAKHFALDGDILDIRPLGNGLINDTYKVTTSEGAPDYVLQRINHHIFTDVDLLQRNIEAVTAHIRAKLEAAGESDLDRKVLHFVPVKEGGKTWYYDGESYWRISVFIDRAKTYETVDPTYSEFAGEAFGHFEAMLADLPEALGETIPDFHNMELRLRQLVDAVREDKAGRLHAAANCAPSSPRSTPTGSACAGPSSCTARESFPNASATATPKSTTCCSTKTVTSFASSTLTP